jgi:hypothetical protein
MLKCVHRFRHVFQLASIRLTLTVGALHYLGLCLHPSPALAAKALFLRTQLALYQERPVKPQRPTMARGSPWSGSAGGLIGDQPSVVRGSLALHVRNFTLRR